VCRFLMIRSTSPFRPDAVLEKFAAMAERSRAPDGDWQGDGCGIAWRADNEQWHAHTSLRPIWEEAMVFSGIPATTACVVHARSASFPDHKNVPDFNQPFVRGHHSFVFNGLLRNVSMPFQVEGRIGSQKIWALLERFLKGQDPAKALNILVSVLQGRSQHVQALNLGLFSGARMLAFCNYAAFPEYYQLYCHRTPTITMVCSEALDGQPFYPLPVNEVTEL